MRIAMFTNEYPPHVYGGAGVHIEYLARELAAAESGAHSIDVFPFGEQRETRGNLRVHGVAPALRPSTLSTPLAEPPAERRAVETEPGETIERPEPMETERPEAEPMPIDTTAELLGRAKGKRQRTRSSAASPRGVKPAGIRKIASRRSPRPKKSTRPETSDESET